jgi:hypothetical protein
MLDIVLVVMYQYTRRYNKESTIDIVICRISSRNSTRKYALQNQP